MRAILIVGGGTAGWLTAAYLARALKDQAGFRITLLESPDIGTIGVGEGAFPTIRATLQFLGIDETRFVRSASATFKQGIRFDNWLHAPLPDGRRHRYLHPFEAPFFAEGVNLVQHWLRQDPATRLPFAEAVTIQQQVVDAGRGPKSPQEGDFSGPLNYAYHFDAAQLGQLLAERAIELGVRHFTGRVLGATVGEGRQIAHLLTDTHGRMDADLYIDCTGFRAELIGDALGTPFRSVRHQLFTDRALACKLPDPVAGAPIPATTIATAHPAGWTWDIALAGARGIGTVFSSAHMDSSAAQAVLEEYVGAEVDARLLTFEPGYRAQQWVGNCVAVGLAGGFLEPLESTGLVLIEAAIAMIADMLPMAGPVAAPAARFNQLMAQRYESITRFLKLHYCLSRRSEPFWRDGVAADTIPDQLRDLLEQWRFRPPSRFDFTLDHESFAYFNYQYILYGMDFRTGQALASDPVASDAAERQFRRIRGFGARAADDLPMHRALVDAFVTA